MKRDRAAYLKAYRRINRKTIRAYWAWYYIENRLKILELRKKKYRESKNHRR